MNESIICFNPIWFAFSLKDCMNSTEKRVPLRYDLSDSLSWLRRSDKTRSTFSASVSSDQRPAERKQRLCSRATEYSRRYSDIESYRDQLDTSRCCFSQWLLTSIKMIKFCFWTEKEIKVNPDPGSARFSTSQGMTLWLRTICDDRTRRRDSFWSAPNRLNNTRSQKQRDINIKAKLHIPDSGIPRVVRKLPNKCGLETGSSSRIKALISVGTSSVESDRYFRPMKTLANVFTKRWTDWRIASGVGGARERNTRLWKSPVEFVHPKISTRMYSLKKFCRS